jgi:glycosyltransferase involved in cell wall biosynthesis
METLPLISCIMPTYGRPEYVNESVAMFLAQDYPRKELIILNDCVGQQFEGEFSNVHFINQNFRFTSLGEKRNTCIQLAKGPVIAVWDDDDVYLPWRLSFSWFEMDRLGTPFYRPAEFWAYWGDDNLHDNQSVPGWVSHAWVMYTKDLWQKVGGYPHIDMGEDAQFFERIHQELGETFIKYELARENRFGILRGTSQYHHMSINGGKNTLDTTPGNYHIVPAENSDPILRAAKDRLVTEHHDKSQIFIKTNNSSENLIFQTRNSKTDVKPELSVCVSLKNRSRIRQGERELTLFPNCVTCLRVLSGLDVPIEMVIADFASDDWPIVEWIEQAAAGMHVRVISVDESFSRGRGLNVAVKYARSDRFLLCDADILVSTAALHRAIDVIDSNKAWFPICRCLDENGVPESWLDFGHGIAGVSRGVFHTTSGVPEFRSWGGEDVIFSARVGSLVPIVRERFEGLFHQWHPDECRNENYERPKHADYYDYCTVQTYLESMPSGKLFKAFLAYHPHWTASNELLLLLSNGRMVRPGVDEGGYEYEEGKYLVLNWDRWPTEKLIWDETQGNYRDPTRAFTLIPVVL